MHLVDAGTNPEVSVQKMDSVPAPFAVKKKRADQVYIVDEILFIIDPFQ